MGKIGDDFGKVPTATELAKELIDNEMREHDGILEQDLRNKGLLQVRLDEGKVRVYWRTVRPGAGETQWDDAAGYTLATWIENDSPIWKWLKFRGADAVQILKRQLAGTDLSSP